MKTNKVIALALSALLITACSKEHEGFIRIMSENMGGGSKVLVDTANIRSGSSWVQGESININDQDYPIVSRSNSYYLDVTSNMPTGDLYAVYPATVQEEGGNNVVVTNRSGEGVTEVTLHRLVVRYTDANHTKHETIFPMASKAAAGSDVMRFQHLTAGLKFKLKASTNTQIASVKVVVQGTAAAQDETLDGVTYRTRWALQGPTTPAGEIGGIVGDRTMSYSSEMYFDMEEPGNDYVTVGASGIVFCVPVTLSDVKRLTVTGYAADGSQLFVQAKDMDPIGENQYITLERNKMYGIPEIEIEN